MQIVLPAVRYKQILKTTYLLCKYTNIIQTVSVMLCKKTENESESEYDVFVGTP